MRCSQEADSYTIVRLDGLGVDIFWDSPSDSVGRNQVYRNGDLIATLPAGTDTYTDTTVVSGMFYTYVVTFCPDVIDS